LYRRCLLVFICEIKRSYWTKGRSRQARRGAYLYPTLEWFRRAASDSQLDGVHQIYLFAKPPARLLQSKLIRAIVTSQAAPLVYQ